jgi:hypothetical protein
MMEWWYTQKSQEVEGGGVGIDADSL